MSLSAIQILASSGNPIEHVADRPWLGTPWLWGGHVMSSHIATMILAAGLLCVVVLSAARLRAIRPTGKRYNLIEAMVLFVRDYIARPALHEKTYQFLPYLLTIFFFILMCNLLGLVPLIDISHAVPGLASMPIGGTPTGNIWVTATLAILTLLTILVFGIAEQVRKFVHHGRSPIVGWTVGFFLYLWSLVPDMAPGVKLLMSPLLIVLEVIGLLAKCFALAVRLFANMNAGHILLAVLLMFITMAAHSGVIAWVVTPASVLGGVAISLLELLVAFIQAFIFTFLSALFIGMAVRGHH